MSHATQLRVKLNIGDDDVARGFPAAKEGDVVTVKDEKIANEMLRRGWAEPANMSAASASDPEPEEQSSVADLNVPDAKDAISRMRSREKLEAIASSDSRVMVQAAARERLTQL